MINALFSSLLKTNNKPPPSKMSDLRTEKDDQFIKQCQPSLESIENIRLQKLKTYEFRKKIGIPLASIATPICGYIDYLLLALQSGQDDGLAGVSILVLGLIYAWVTTPKRQYTKAYKIEILPKIAKLFGNLTYNNKGKINIEYIQSSNIIPRHDSYSSEDYFAGEYKGIKLEFSEIKLEKWQRSTRRKRQKITVFKGLAILLNTNHKSFFGHTIISRNQTKAIEWLKEKSSRLERAEMVDPEFEKTFDVYTNDQVEARYLIDPIMIEKLKNLYKEYNGKGMQAAFYDNKMLILINSPYNHFEPADLTVSAFNKASLLKLRHEVGDILSIIDKLSLYDPKAIKNNQTTIST